MVVRFRIVVHNDLLLKKYIRVLYDWLVRCCWGFVLGERSGGSRSRMSDVHVGARRVIDVFGQPRHCLRVSQHGEWYSPVHCIAIRLYEILMSHNAVASIRSQLWVVANSP